MLQHRFRDQFEQPTTNPVPAGTMPGFVVCPYLVSPGLMMAPSALLTAIYQAARERIAAQAKPVRRAIPAFSLN